ncbi:MAG: alpha/beta hydrolase [Rhodobacter sp.]|nr:alpha/beta hydrolase [Rhodobacter sp.]
MAASLVIAAALIGGGAALVNHRVSARTAAAEAAFPPTGRMLRVNGRAVHADVSGTGPDVVLIHGASGNTRDFTFDLARRLAARYRVIVFDRPGLGWSDDAGQDGISPQGQARILRDAARQLGAERPVILGHSYGGAVAMAWALQDADGTAALVLLGGATMPWPGGLGGWYSLTSGRLGRAVAVPLVSAFAPLSQTLGTIAGIFAPDPVPAGYAEYVGAGLTLRPASLGTNARQVNGLRPFIVEMSQAYAQLPVPVEIVHGSADTIVPASIHAIPLSTLLPDAVLTLLPGIGHMPHHADPVAVVAAIDRAAARARLR